MFEAWFIASLALMVIGAAYYQSFRDKRRWERVVSGRPMNIDREKFPVLVVDGQSFQANQRRVMIVWGDMTHSGFRTTSDARQEIERSSRAGQERAAHPRMFVWDGELWTQR